MNSDKSLLEFTGERFMPGVHGNIELEHLHRYLIACEIAVDKDVLDIASGEGYGSAMLAEKAKTVIGVDISREAVKHAQDRYRKQNLKYMVGHCAEIPLPDNSIDLVVSFETIEHHDQHEEMMEEIRRVLRSDGLLLISSPDKYNCTIATGYNNPYHVKELYRHEFEKLLKQYYSSVSFFGQRVVFGSGVFSDVSGASVINYYNDSQDIKQTVGLRKPTYWIALASNGVLPELSMGIFEQPVSESQIVRYWVDVCAQRDGQIAMLQQIQRTQEERILALDQELIECNSGRDQEVAKRVVALAERDQAVVERAVALAERDQVVAERAMALAERDQAVAERAMALAERDQERMQITALRNSTFWRITAPIRLIKGKVLKGRGRLGKWMRAAYKAMPLPTDQKLRFKSYIFFLLSPILKNTVSYRAWVDFEQNRVELISETPGEPDEHLASKAFEKFDICLVDLEREASIQKSLSVIYRYCSKYGPITHLIVLPFLGSGGAERVALNFAKAVTENRPGISVLIVIADGILVDKNMELPAGSMLLVLEHILSDSDYSKKQALLSDLIRAIRPRVTHNINSEVGWSLICNEGHKLRSYTKFYGSIFSLQRDQQGVKIGYAAQFFLRSLPHLICMLSDNRRFFDDVASEYKLSEADRSGFHVVYNPSRVPSRLLQSAVIDRLNFLATQPAPISRLRVLWAGRLDADKRLDLLYEVVHLCKFADFYVFGKAVVDGDGSLPNIDNLFYCGPFGQPEELVENSRYDAFIFTTRQEGMPNILLEVGALGVPIVAPAIGGIAELICEKTGYLLSADPSAAEYRNALLQIGSHPSEAALRGRALLELIDQRHCWRSFKENVHRIPGYLE